jgi:hypothetical protein
MTQKHFRSLAGNLRLAHPQGTDQATTESIAAWSAACQAVADACAQLSTTFDRRRFLLACAPVGVE